MTSGNLNGSNPVMSSDWGRISPQLLASFYAVKKIASQDKQSVYWERDLSEPVVVAPLSDGNIEATLNWQSTFENTGPDQRFSAFTSMLQAGGFSTLLAELKALLPKSTLVDSAATKAAALEGRSNLTKLNSTQIFTGMPPLKITVTAHFRAFKDAKREVRDPVNQLVKWALPKEIAQDGIVTSAARLEAEVFPSEVPQILAMRFADMLFAPIVIESIPYPLTGPRDSNGVMTHASLALNLASLTALDRRDWTKSLQAGG